MIAPCAPPDATVGVAIRLAQQLDCQARVLGENGFQAIAGGPLAGGLLSGVVTIFVALIGYRLLLGQIPDVRDGIGWAVRLGIVLTLISGWPAFQTLIYRVAVDGPVEMAQVLLPASGLSDDALEARVQGIYDTIRVGTIDASALAGASQATQQNRGEAAEAPASNAPTLGSPAGSLLGQPPRPQTATWFVVSTIGFVSALRIAVGLTLALAPLALLALLFDATLGLFIGWLRSIAGAALALIGATVVTVLHVAVIENELAGLEAAKVGAAIAQAADMQGLSTIVLVFAVVMVIAICAAVRMAGAIHFTVSPRAQTRSQHDRAVGTLPSSTPVPWGHAPDVARPQGSQVQERVQSIVDTLTSSARREQLASASTGNESSARSRTVVIAGSGERDAAMSDRGLGTAGRRSTVRRSRSAARRDSRA